MTKKHFEAIAEEVKDANFDSTVDKVKFIRGLSNKLEQFDERFDRKRFSKACFDTSEFMSKSEMRRITNQV
jgi:hypothetical protein